MKRQEGLRFALWLCLLNAMSGLVNISTLLLFATPSTHMTGNLSQLALALARGDLNQAAALFGLLTAFVSGAFISGLLFADKNFRLANRYGLALISLGLVIGLDYLFNAQGASLYILAFTVGVQNGMFIYYRGMIVRTSHFTGYLTDTGFALGRLLRGHPEDLEKILFYLTSMLCFCCGGLAAYYWLSRWSHTIFLAIAGAYILIGIYYFIFRQLNTHHKGESHD